MSVRSRSHPWTWSSPLTEQARPAPTTLQTISSTRPSADRGLTGGETSVASAGVAPRNPPPAVTRMSPRSWLRIRSRVIEIELQRGEAPTPASLAALSLRYSGGIETLVPVLVRLDSQPFVRGWSYDSESAANVFSHLVRSSFPRRGRHAGAIRGGCSRPPYLRRSASSSLRGVRTAMGEPGGARHRLARSELRRLVAARAHKGSGRGQSTPRSVKPGKRRPQSARP